MKQKIIQKIRECCPETIDREFENFPVPKELNLQHLLRAIENYRDKRFEWKMFVSMGFMSMYVGSTKKIDYNLDKSLEENLENKELCELLVEILNIK